MRGPGSKKTRKNLWADTQIRDREACEEMRRGHCGRRILFHGLFELWIIERCPEMGDGLPYGVVHQNGAAGDALMELSGNEPRLSFHHARVMCPRFEECRDICFGD